MSVDCRISLVLVPRRLLVVPPSRDGVEVGAGGEDPARPGQDDGADLVVGVDRFPGFGQPAQHLRVHGVLESRSIHGQRDQMAVAIDQQRCFAHVSSFRQIFSGAMP
jgi:hypothetical protein